MYLYIHGFLSSSQSCKAQQLKQWLTQQRRAHEWLCPDLPIDPRAAMQLLRDNIERAPQPLTLIGSSLGGFYATALAERYQLKTIVINPAVHAGKILRDRIGNHQAWHSNQTLNFTQQHVDALNAIDVGTITQPDNFFLLLEKGDETLDYRQALNLYRDCNQLIFNGGDHSFSRFQQVLSLIDSFAD